MAADRDHASGRWQGQAISEWWPVLIGLALLYVPMYYSLATTLWQSEENAHGPIVLAVVLWLVWQKRHIIAIPTAETNTVIGVLLFVLGLALYVVGRSEQIWIFEIGSQIPVFTGLLFMFCGRTAVRALWFPIFFLLFMLPLPSLMVDTLTGPLKQYISTIVEEVMYVLGYPIGRNGVVLTIGDYQLLVADACSGLNSMFSLTAMGVLYLYVMHRTNRLRNGLLLAAIWPIAFVANIVRVMVLVLVTYYLGEAAGQGFLHGFAGIVLFVVAMLMLIVLDWLLGLTLSSKRSVETLT